MKVFVYFWKVVAETKTAGQSFTVLTTQITSNILKRLLKQTDLAITLQLAKCNISLSTFIFLA